MTVESSTTALLRIEVHYFAAAKAAAGHASETIEISATATMGDLEAVLGRDNPSLAYVLQRCSYLRDSVAVRDRGAALAPCSRIEVLPPFAGG